MNFVDFFRSFVYNNVRGDVMTSENLLNLIDEIVKSRAEYQYVELKAAKKGCPEKFYDTLSSFSNRDDGGIIIFGIDETNDYDCCGVYDLQDMQQKITEQCDSMCPKVRPLFSYAERDGKYFCSIEIPAVDISDRPCYYAGKGRLKGSYVRVGTNDEPMTEYEIYSYEAYRKKYQDDIRPISRVTQKSLDEKSLNEYIELLSINKPNLSKLDREQIMELMSITVNGEYSLATTLMFGLYPQAFFPQLCIIATVLPTNNVGDLGVNNERFIDNERIEGSIKEMLIGAINFVRRNTRTKTIIDSYTGERRDIGDYPITAIREVLLNALVHRDYSIHTEGMPIQLQIFPDRIVVTNPGGLYGRITLDQLGQIQADTRNPLLATSLETLRLTENRYSGIPTVRREMKEYGLPMPQFEDARGTFRVTLFGKPNEERKRMVSSDDILTFCSVSRTREEIADFLGIKSVPYAIKTYITPLVECGKIKLSNPKHPKSPDQKYTTK